MSAKMKILTGAAGIAAAVGLATPGVGAILSAAAIPAARYPGYGYGNQESCWPDRRQHHSAMADIRTATTDITSTATRAERSTSAPARSSRA